MNPAIEQAIEALEQFNKNSNIGFAVECQQFALAALRAIPRATEEEIITQVLDTNIFTYDYTQGFRACELHHFGPSTKQEHEKVSMPGVAVPVVRCATCGAYDAFGNFIALCARADCQYKQEVSND